MVTDLTRFSALALLDGYGTRAFSPVEVIDALAGRIEAVEPLLKAFLTLTLDEARREAAEAERLYARAGGERRPLEGVPLAVKDLFDTAGVQTTYGSPMFLGHEPAADAEAVRRARSAGAVVIGKTSTHEFAWGITSHNPHFDSGRNPWALDRVSGGSSGGSGVALATHEAPLALGTDTGGSIRAPAAFCGIVGLKPTYGMVSTKGVFPLAGSLDHAGPMGRTPTDVALLYSALSESAPPAATLFEEMRSGVEGLRVGISPDLLGFALADDVERVFHNSRGLLGHLGAQLVEVSFPEATEILPTFYVIQRAEALAAHRRAGLYPQRREEYGADVRSRLEAAEQTTLADYLECSVVRERIRAGFVRVFSEVDVLLTPVSAGPPVLRGDDEIVHFGESVPFRDVVLTFTTPQDLAGLPACAVRAGFDGLGIPVGVQFSGPPGAEPAVLRAAQAFWEASGAVQARWPELAAA
jgi:aspartyl-tRNA(Asn)/glutamyl-tRNA(Gln) amidotransferase subunit A